VRVCLNHRQQFWWKQVTTTLIGAVKTLFQTGATAPCDSAFFYFHYNDVFPFHRRSRFVQASEAGTGCSEQNFQSAVFKGS